MGRRVWSDVVVEKWTKKFVAAADEVWRLQNDDEPECRLFRRTVLGSEAPHRGSMQGTYVFAPSGKLLARRNSNSPAVIAKLLEEAWQSWLALPDSERALGSPEGLSKGFRWEQFYPEAGLVLRRTARDLPPDGDPAAAQHERFNRDAVWFSPTEARSLFAQSVAAGAKHRVPLSLTKRLSCLVFVDNARGQTIPYHPSEDAGSELHSEIVKIAGDRVTITLTGQTAASAKGPWLFDEASIWTPSKNSRSPHSIEVRVLGQATYDLTRERFVAFELLALGQREGRTVNHARSSSEASGIGFVCELAPHNWRVPPTYLDTYDVDWARAQGK